MPCAMENIFAVNVGRKNKSFKPCTQHSSSALSVGGDWMCTERTARFATRAHTHLGPVLEHRRNSPSVHPILQVKRLEAGRPVVMSLALPTHETAEQGGSSSRATARGLSNTDVATWLHFIYDHLVKTVGPAAARWARSSAADATADELLLHPAVLRCIAPWLQDL